MSRRELIGAAMDILQSQRNVADRTCTLFVLDREFDAAMRFARKSRLIGDLWTELFHERFPANLEK